jgi:hypothetical protein
LSGFSADESELDPEGRPRQVLEVCTDTGSLIFLLSAPHVAELLAEVGRRSARWERSRRPAVAIVGRPIAGAARRLVAALAVAAAWVAATWYLVDLVVRAVTSMVVTALGASWPVRAAARGTLKLSAGIGALWSGLRTWIGATMRVLLIPVVALVSPAGRTLARLSAPVRRRLAATLVGLVVAEGWRRGCSATRSVIAAADRSVRARLRAHRRLPAILGSGALAATLTAASFAGLVGGGAAVSGAARARYRGGLISAVPTTPGATSSASMIAMVHAMQGKGQKPLDLPAATAPPAPAPPSLANEPPLAPHEVFGFAPYWNLPMSTGFDVNGLTTIAYFSVGVNANGTLDQNGSGWNGYQSQEFANLVTRAHAAGDRVVLTVNCFDQGALNQLTSTPGAPGTLAQAVVHAIEAKNLDGVNIDFEGQGAGDQSGLTNLVTQVSAAVHGADPHYQVTMDTYASSAGDPSGFYNIKALAPVVDGFFVMAYQLNLQSGPNPGSPLTSSMFSDLSTVEQYAAAVPSSKVILGVPYYGYEWPTDNGTMSAQATGGATPVTYSQIMAGGTPVYWDPITDTAWTSYQVGGQWFEDYFEDPTSLYLVAQLAQFFSLDGVGIWALGMDGNSPSMLAALDGFAPAQKVTTVGPTSTSASTPASTPGSTTTTAPRSTISPPKTTLPPTSPPTSTPGTTVPISTTTPPSTTTVGSNPGTTFRFSGVWKGQTVNLTWQGAPTSTESGTPNYLGTLTGFQTNDPAYTCLASGSGLAVWQFSSDVGVDVVIAEQPANCAAATFTFPAAPSAPGATSSSLSSGTNGSSTNSTGSSGSSAPSRASP